MDKGAWVHYEIGKSSQIYRELCIICISLKKVDFSSVPTGA
jgi:hypothetical protein